MDRIKHHAPFLSGLVAAGGVGVGHIITPVMIPLIFALPVLLRLTKTPTAAASLVGGYILSASYGLFFGVANLSGFWVGLATWFGLALCLSIPWLFAHIRWTGLIIAITLMSIPPLGYLSHVSPLMGAAYLFPGFGFIGLFLCAIVFQVLYILKWPYSVSIVCAMLISTVVFQVPTTATSPTSISGLHPRDMQVGPLISNSNCCETDYQARQALFDNLLRYETASGIPIYPEASAGTLSKITTNELTRFAQATNQPFFAGAEERVGRSYNNVLIHVDHQSANIVYRQRLPAPWFMWRGQDKPRFFRAGLGRAATFAYQRKRIGTLICYELSTTWLVFDTHFESPDAVIAISNLWWAKKTNLAYLMRLQSAAWSRLFGVPYIFSLNT